MKYRCSCGHINEISFGNFKQGNRCARCVTKKNAKKLRYTFEYVKNYLDWGAGPRASQNLILAAKAHAAFNGKFSPDIEDVKAVSIGILRHRIIKNYKADAEGITEEMIINKLL